MSSHSSQRPMVRRHFLAQGGAAALALGLSGGLLWAQEKKSARKTPRIPGGDTKAESGFALPPLPYDYDALQPTIDAETMKIHHGKHHQGYINNLNAALTGHAELLKLSLAELLTGLDQVPKDIRKTVRNNAGGHANHTLFWSIMGPDKGGDPQGDLAKAIAKDFGGFPNFKEQFNQTATKHFGSGWAWLSVGTDGKLVLESLPNQDNPAMNGKTPILGLDVWEHAYYLKYKNARAEYVKAWWNVVNWDQVAKNYAEAKA